MAGQGATPSTTFTRRALGTAALGGGIWALLLARLGYLQLAQHEKYAGIAAENQVRLDLQPPRRGEILDRFGRPLASHRRAGRVTLVREQVGDLAGTLARIAALIDLPPEREEAIIRDALRQPSFLPTLVARELSYEDFSRLTAHSAELDGVQVEMALTRSYPRGRDFAHVIGYVARANDRDVERLLAEGLSTEETSGDEKAQNAKRSRLIQMFKHPDMRVGRSGVEFFADDWLRGEHGFRRVEANAAGRIIRELPSEDVAAKPGRNVTLSLDAELQRAAIDRFGEESGAAVLIDARSGDILALVSTPAFDPNDFVNGISSADYNLLRENDRSPLYHKAYDGTYPPGSTFKMVVGTAALEAGVIDPREELYCPGHYRFGNRTWHCWKRGGHGSVNMHRGLKVSCDVYFYEIAKRLGVEKIAEVSRRFGFGHVWELGMTGGRSGVVPDPAWKERALGESWFEGETLNYGIGQGYLHTSPLQLAMMTAKIAMDGRLVIPRLLVDGPEVVSNPPKDGAFDAEHIARMKAGMYGVTSEVGGTALRSGDVGFEGIRMAGKTGTAQVRRISTAERASGVRANEDLERHLRDHALFVGYAPHDNPRYAVAVVVEHGGGGSATAAPIARDIMREAFIRDSGREPSVKTASVLDSEGGPG